MRSILTFLLLLSLSAKAQTVNPDRTITSWKTYAGTELSVDYPSNWSVKEPDESSPFLYFFSPLRSRDDRFKENVNILHQNVAGLDLTLDSLVQVSIDNMKSEVLTNIEVIESKRLKREGGEYHKVVCKGDMKDYHLIFVQYYWLSGSNAYVITFTGEQNYFPLYQQTAEQILNSFRLKG